MESLLSKLTKLLEEEYGKLRGVSKQIKFLRDELSAMSAALQMLADAEQLNPLMRDWRDKLRKLAYDIEDCIDSFMAGGPTYWDFGAKRAVEISERHKRYNFADLPSSSSTAPGVDPRLPALYEEIDRLVGIGGPKKHIIQLLAMETNRHIVISIVGCGGLGKTTLANQVYHTTKSQFDCAAFVSVSRTPDIRKILRDIAKEVGDIDITLDDDERQLVNKLRKYLQEKRYFVVIDDVWDAEAWTFIKLALPNNDHSRMVTTTRSVTVAKCSSSKDRYVYEMEPLSFTDSKRLFFRRAFGSENSCYPHLKDVPDIILRKCGGLPLAVITISSMLTNKHEKTEWDRVESAIGSALAEKPEAEKMVSILSLSYFDMPHHLRTCLLYLSVFPEDYRIEKQCLINRWISEGFVQEEQGQNAYDRGEHYFYNLINRSLIQPVDIEYDDQAEACRVHDIILDYIKCKAAEESFVTSLDAADHVHTSSEYKGYPFSLDSWHPGAPYSLQKLCMQGYHIYKVPNWMGSHRNLRVLELLVMFVRPEDVEILGEISSLLFLTLCTAGGSNGRIVVHGNNRFRSLKYFFLSFFACGTAIEFEATSMPKLEHLKLVFPAHNVECLNGAPNMGIQHLSGLSKVDIKIGNDLYDGTLGYVNAAVGALPNSPTIRVKRSNAGCVHFKSECLADRSIVDSF
ncbi:hypothetical protein U9M48_040677 [Paspalum notatum var. saurae]|uniref:Uncharacterized protein n=1 Tax=Paspalum notatum var. saurae TaxID=547442 RepID=A0AAQ3UNL7_PASNO